MSSFLVMKNFILSPRCRIGLDSYIRLAVSRLVAIVDVYSNSSLLIPPVVTRDMIITLKAKMPLSTFARTFHEPFS